MDNWLLWSRFALLNIIGFAGVVLLYINGWISKIIEGDSSNISFVIFGLFIGGLVMTALRINKLTRELDDIRNGKSSRVVQYWKLFQDRGNTVATQVTQIRLLSKIQWIRRIASSLTLLGLIGTVLGAITFLLGVDIQALGDVNTIGAAFAVVLEGMGIALYTTLVGAVLNMWLPFNYGIAETGTAHLLTSLMDSEPPSE